ncbi:hypothetical protein SAMN04488112_10146 [Melghirimyces thermohalophilus]|uniref:AEC family transporter n=1 Tax=Melghirimyces thermohalophilus TaxID=1236220 RepID=A0A1G6HL56_9BACL|nr:AEC family transporter [Melghirimyces thermohalophilus]SDB94893.1 hypothetical protein SAMN04488112_10146 [Melghirimyces thermohalophilus]
MIFVNVMLPVFLIFGAGFVGQKLLHLHIRSVSAAALYLMSPWLAFRTFYDNEVGFQQLSILIYSVSLCFILIGIVKLYTWIRGYTSSEESGLVLATAFMNNGNMGVPVILFAFGREAFDYAVMIMVIHTFLMGTLGIYMAARGSMSGKEALKPVLKMPIAYTAVLGLLWQQLNWPMPEEMYKAISLLADASIPTIMLALGMQLSTIRLYATDMGKMIFANVTRLLVSPLIAWGIALLLGVEPLLMKVMVIAAAMPAAAITTMYSLQFDSEPKLVSSITLTSTLLSALTISALLWLFS